MRLALKAAAFFLATTSLVGADTATKSIGDQLRAAGYTNVRTKLSGINRFRVTASKSGRERVIVVNTRTGRIVRDSFSNDFEGPGDDVDDDDDDDYEFEGPDDDDDNESEDDSDGDDDDNGGEDDSDGADDD